MVFSRLARPDLQLALAGASQVPHEEILAEIDRRLDKGQPLTVIFDTAAPAKRLYAVEMDAGPALAALALTEGVAPPASLDPGRHIDHLTGGAFLWRETTPRLFLGDCGSMTCAHKDITPQLELAHGLFGTKLVGVASPGATPRLAELHAASESEDDEEEWDEGEDATRIPTDRELGPRQRSLLSDGALSVAALGEGSLLVFASGQLHFASNGADLMSGALYHGAVTRAALPALRAAAAADARSSADAQGGAYANHLHARDVLREISREGLKHDAPAAQRRRKRRK